MTKVGKSEIIGSLLSIEASISSTLESSSNNAMVDYCELSTDNFIADSSSVKRQVTKIKKSLSGVWKKSLNERKQAYWNNLRFQNTAVVYESWLGKENPVIIRKFRPKLIIGEHEEDRTIRKENALRNVEAEIRILKNKARRHETKFRQVDDEMQTIFSRKAQGEVFENLKDIWKNDCEREEIKSNEIWENKKNWLDNY